MWGGFSWGAATWASQPQYVQGEAGLVFGSDFDAGRVFGYDQASGAVVTGEIKTGNVGIVFGGDSSSGEGKIVGGDEGTGVVFGGDERN